MAFSRSVLDSLRKEFVTRAPRIQKSALLTKLEVGPITGTSFNVRAWWPGGDTNRNFLYDECFITRGGQAFLRMSVCRLTQRFIQDILQERGL